LLKQIGATIVRGPLEVSWAPGYYYALFEDPDGIRLEVNHVPGAGVLAEAALFNPTEGGYRWRSEPSRDLLAAILQHIHNLSRSTKHAVNIVNKRDHALHLGGLCLQLGCCFFYSIQRNLELRIVETRIKFLNGKLVTNRHQVSYDITKSILFGISDREFLLQIDSCDDFVMKLGDGIILLLSDVGFACHWFSLLSSLCQISALTLPFWLVSQLGSQIQ
jgi:hypothetical protein